MSIFGESDESREKRRKKFTREGSFTYLLSADEPKVNREVFYRLIWHNHTAFTNSGDKKLFMRALKKVNSFESLITCLHDNRFGTNVTKRANGHLIVETLGELKESGEGTVTPIQLTQVLAQGGACLFSYLPARLNGEPVNVRYYTGRILSISPDGISMRVALNDGTLKEHFYYEIKDFALSRITGIRRINAEFIGHYRFVRVEINRDHERGIATVTYFSTMGEPETMTEDLRQGESVKALPARKTVPALNTSQEDEEKRVSTSAVTIESIESFFNKRVKIRWNDKTYALTPREYLHERESNTITIYGDHLVTEPLPLREIEITEYHSNNAE